MLACNSLACCWRSAAVRLVGFFVAIGFSLVIVPALLAVLVVLALSTISRPLRGIQRMGDRS